MRTDAPAKHDASDRGPTPRDIAIARVLRPLGTKPMTKEQAVRAGQLLGVHHSTVYRLRRRFLADPVATSVAPSPRGPDPGGTHIDSRAEEVIDAVLSRWLPRQRFLAHPLLDITMEVKHRCAAAGIPSPSRNTVARRWARHRELQALRRVDAPGAQIPPGHLVADAPLELVQIDHTQADLIVVDELLRQPIGRPWISLAIDVATRCVVGLYVALERPNAAIVARLLTRVVLPKTAWLQSLGVEADWPMNGIPKCLHLDNAAEFKSRALRTGCAQYGIELTYRPVGRPHFGGHVERLNRTLMERLKGLPGATGNSTKGRKERQPEKGAAMTLAQFERWLVLEVAQRYHHSEHRGLAGATPAGVWADMCDRTPPHQLPFEPEAALRFLVQFLPLESRTIQGDGLTLFYVRYWHPIFAAWRENRRKVLVRYHPEDLSRVFVTVNGKTYIEARYADLRRPRISLWEQRQACRRLRQQGHRELYEALVFKAIDEQRRIVERARTQTRTARRKASATAEVRRPADVWAPPAAQPPAEPVDYSLDVEPFPVEIW